MDCSEWTTDQRVCDSRAGEDKGKQQARELHGGVDGGLVDGELGERQMATVEREEGF